MSLQDEIRIVLVAYGKPVHAANIRMMVASNRGKAVPSLKTFINIMGQMPDVESVRINRIWYRQITNEGFQKHTLSYHLRGILILITVEGKKLCTLLKEKALLMRLGFIKEVINKSWRR
jgi:hypothetical protein